ncbi:hypothetical protein BH10BAC4_BH10BAC4_09550 [soil metagenome]
MITKRFTQIFLGLMSLAFCKVGIEALINPHTVLAQVGILLDNASATSSMRAVYGGMHLMFGVYCISGIFKDSKGPLQLLTLYTAGFVLGRITGIVADGSPNTFVMTWLITETVSLATAGTLLIVQGRRQRSGDDGHKAVIPV